MGKRLKRRTSNNNAIAVEHPELGGTFFTRPMSFDEGTRYAELVTKEDFDRDRDGSIIFNPQTGQPVKKYAGDPREHVDFAISLLDRIEDLDSDCVIAGMTIMVDAVCCASSSRSAELIEAHITAVRLIDPDVKATPADVIAAHRDVMRDVLTLMGTSDVEFEVDIDAAGNEIKGADRAKKTGTRKVMKPVKENAFLWLTRESAKLANQRNEVAKGN